MRAMVLAAGRGERMRPVTDHTPKPLLEVGGETLIERHLRALAAAGIVDVVINVAWLGEQIRERLGTGAACGLRLHYSQEPAGALETGGGIRQGLALLGEGPFLVVNGDVWCDVDYGRLLRTLRLAPADLAALLLVETPAYKPHHDFAIRGERIVPGEPTHTFSGIGLYRARLFAGLPLEPARFPLGPLLRQAIAAGQVSGALHAGLWYDVGTPERLAALDLRLSRSNP